MENMELWNKVKQPPPEALKQITGGRLKGMTDIKPQWRYQVMTEQFGPCGTGWYYVPEREWTETGPDGQVFAFVTIKLYVKVGDEHSMPIYGIGGSMLIEKETAGLHANDEAFKMATTDALSTAMQKIGVAADIYAGLWDGSKYRTATDGGSSGQSGKSGQPAAKHPPITGDTPHECQVHNSKFYENSPGKWSHKIVGSSPPRYCQEDSVEKIAETTTANHGPCDQCATWDDQLSEHEGKMICVDCFAKAE